MADQTPSGRPSAAATDIPELMTDLEAGMFERALSVALSQTSASVLAHSKKGKVAVVFDVEEIPGTSQVRIGHTIKFTKPTSTGRSSEEFEGATVLHVGKNGRLSLSQPDMFGKDQKQDKLV